MRGPSVRSSEAALTDAEGGLVGPALLIVATLIRRAANLTYKQQLGLSPIEWSLIARLGHRGPMTPSTLADISAFDKGQISRALVVLEAKKLIVKRELTWRSVELRLSTSGQKQYAVINRISKNRQMSLTRGLTRNELQQFNKLLDTIAANATGMLKRLKDSEAVPED